MLAFFQQNKKLSQPYRWSASIPAPFRIRQPASSGADQSSANGHHRLAIAGVLLKPNLSKFTSHRRPRPNALLAFAEAAKNAKKLHDEPTCPTEPIQANMAATAPRPPPLHHFPPHPRPHLHPFCNTRDHPPGPHLDNDPAKRRSRRPDQVWAGDLCQPQRPPHGRRRERPRQIHRRGLRV